MRILHVTDCYLPRVGGIELHVSDLVRHQRAVGNEPVVWTRTRDGGIDTGSEVMPLSAGVLREALRRSRPDVVHAHVSVWSPLAMLGTREAARLGVPTVVTVHSMWSHLGRVPAVATAGLGARDWSVRWSAVSSVAARAVRTALADTVDVAVVPNAVDLDFWRPRAPQRPQAREAADPLIVSTLRFTPTKRPMELIDILSQVAARSATPFHAVLIGEGPLYDRARRRVRRYGLADRIQLPGRLDRAQIRRVLSDAQLYVAPAELESFGIAALEARRLGVPVVASNRSGVGDFVSDGIDGALVGSDEGFVDTLVALLADPDRRGALASACRRYPPALGWDTALANNERLYSEAAAIAAGHPVANSVSEHAGGR